MFDLRARARGVVGALPSRVRARVRPEAVLEQMKNKLIDDLAAALKATVGLRMRQSGLISWNDDRTWHELAEELVPVLAKSHAVVERVAYAKLVEDAQQMGRVREHVEGYKKLKVF